MRLRTLLLVSLLLITVQPAASANGCRIDLGDPTNPQIYGDCVGGESSVTANDQGVTFRKDTDATASVEDALGCEGDCTFGISHSVMFTAELKGHQDEPELELVLGFHIVRGHDRSAGTRSDCMGGVGSGSVLPMPCVRLKD